MNGSNLFSRGVFVAGIAFASTLLLGAGQQAKKPPSAGEQGHVLFTKNCAACHGAKAAGGEGPDLRGTKLSDAKITATISEGIKNEMPAFKGKLKSADIKQIIAFLRTLKK